MPGTATPHKYPRSTSEPDTYTESIEQPQANALNGLDNLRPASKLSPVRIPPVAMLEGSAVGLGNTTSLKIFARPTPTNDGLPSVVQHNAKRRKLKSHVSLSFILCKALSTKQWDASARKNLRMVPCRSCKKFRVLVGLHP